MMKNYIRRQLPVEMPPDEAAAAEAPAEAPAPAGAPEAPAPRLPFTAAEAPRWLLVPHCQLLPALAEPRGPRVADASCRPGAVYSEADDYGRAFFTAIKRATNYQDDVSECEQAIVIELRRRRGTACVNALYLPADTFGMSPLGCAIISARSSVHACFAPEASKQCRSR